MEIHGTLDYVATLTHRVIEGAYDEGHQPLIEATISVSGDQVGVHADSIQSSPTGARRRPEEAAGRAFPELTSPHPPEDNDDGRLFTRIDLKLSDLPTSMRSP